MSNGDTGFLHPMRIELATSEMEGGDYLSWADPEQVIACVVRPQPQETFSRFIEPQLMLLDRSLGEGPPVGSNRLPDRLRNLLERLRQIHGDLVRENRTVLDLPYTARLTLAMVEEDRVFFVKGTPCWIYLIRDGIAGLAGGSEEALPGNPEGSALGESDRLNLALSSIEVEPNDIVVLQVAGGGECPDRRAVAQVFAQTADLKRACDGLVNLLGLQSSGAGVVAMRFVPVSSAGGREISGSKVIEELERELIQQLSDRPDSGDSSSEQPVKRFGHVDESEVPLPAFLEEAGSEKPAAAGEQEAPGTDPELLRPCRFPWESVEEDSAPPKTEAPPVDGGGPSGEGDRVEEPAAPVAAEITGSREPEVMHTGGEGGETPPPGRPSVLDEFPPPGRGGVSRTWPLLLGIVVILLIAVTAVPQLRLFSYEREQAATGVLRVNPDPPARAIFIDGVDMQTGSPALLEQLEVGKHHVKLDLGAFGAIESEIYVAAGGIVDLKPVASGSLEIAATIARPGAVAWVKGREPREVPCRFDSLPVGWVDVFYEDAQVPLWQREIIVRSGQSFRLRVNNAVASDRSLLRIESWVYQEGQGLVESLGDSLRIDGRFVGVTPWEKEVVPGLHGVKVSCENEQVWTEVVEMMAGGTRIVAPRFGMERWPRIIHVEPGQVLLQGPVLLSATIQDPGGSRPRNPRLHLPGLDATVCDLPLSAIDPEEGVYVGVVDRSSIPLGRSISYYFTVETSAGRTLCSELYRFTAVLEVSQNLIP